MTSPPSLTLLPTAKQIIPANRIDALHLSLTAVGGDSRFARFPIGNHPLKARPAFNVQCRVMISMRLEPTIVTPVLSHREAFAQAIVDSTVPTDFLKLKARLEDRLSFFG